MTPFAATNAGKLSRIGIADLRALGMERLAFVGGGCASFAAFSVVIDHFMKFS